uniref:branched-chain-amino-acid transaminase n=2 Tax=Hirondellea gigas TaxID=1518452 RepID=A0A2P2ID95_9CRUS
MLHLIRRGGFVSAGRFFRFQHSAPRILPDVQFDDMVIESATTLKEKLPNKDLKFGATFTDHMLEIDWDSKNGWHAPKISPYHNFEMNPACSALHYSLQCFEGLKAYYDPKLDKIRMFRPMENMKRMNVSCERLHFPSFDHEQVMQCIKQLIRMERDWVPKGSGYSLYIRPAVISTHPFIGVAPAESVKFFTILSPVGPYYPSGFSPITLYADDKYVRAWPGGVGFAKIGGNYAPTIRPALEAAELGFSQILWLFGPDHYVTEVGTMNQFFFWKRKDGRRELITAPLDGTILAGVTRKSILEMSREWGEFEVTERPFTIHEVIEAVDDGRLIEAFGAGTAAVVSPVNGFHYRGKDYKIPLNPEKPSEQAGPLTQRIWDTMEAIHYGATPHEWSELIE